MNETEKNLEFDDFPYICRICLFKGDTKPFTEDLQQIFSRFYNSSIEDNDDELPKNICTACVARLTDIKGFIDLALLSEERLKDVLIKHKHRVSLQYFGQDTKFEISDEDNKFDKNEIANPDTHSIEVNSLSSDDSNETDVEVKVEENDDIKQYQFLCKICQDIFINFEDLTEHRKLNENCAFKCQNCQKTFETKKKLYAHKTENEKCQLEQYKCNVCGKVFKRISLLKRHKGAHTDETPYACKLCDKKFKFPQNLRRHDNIIHKGIKPFKCDICGKEYGQPGMLKDHMNTHGIKLYECEYCQQKYGTWTNFYKHIQKHKIEMNDPTARPQIKKISGPIECKICLKVFSSKESLKVHKHTLHTNIQGYLCSICGKKFNRRLTMACHLQGHRGDVPFECELCNKTFVRLSQLKAHMNSHMKEKRRSKN